MKAGNNPQPTMRLLLWGPHQPAHSGLSFCARKMSCGAAELSPGMWPGPPARKSGSVMCTPIPGQDLLGGGQCTGGPHQAPQGLSPTHSMASPI